MNDDFNRDIHAVSQIAAVPTILDVVCRTTGMGFAAVARVTEGRWIACSVKDDIAFGLQPGGELKVETTICHEIRGSREPVVINHVAADEQYCGHPTPALYGFQSYISMPIVLADGTFFGTLCAIDPKPARLDTPEVVGMFRLFAELIAQHLEADRRIETTKADLLDERHTAVLREQFIAILGHDLRNPLAAFGSGTNMLLRTPLNDRARMVVGMMQASLARMNELVGNMLDFARIRLGGGMAISRDADRPLGPMLAQVVAELQAVWPDRSVTTTFKLDGPTDCDPDRIGQLFSNLLSNALTHGAPGGPIVVEALSEAGHLRVSVSNEGDPIPAEVVERLFRPFSRGAVKPNQQGLGLGLHIAAEIARAHGGGLTVTSTAEQTRFTFEMPRPPDA